MVDFYYHFPQLVVLLPFFLMFECMLLHNGVSLFLAFVEHINPEKKNAGLCFYAPELLEAFLLYLLKCYSLGE